MTERKQLTATVGSKLDSSDWKVNLTETLKELERKTKFNKYTNGTQGVVLWKTLLHVVAFWMGRPKI